MTEQGTKFNWANWCERSCWTAVQSFLAVFVVADVSTLRSAAIAGVAAVISAVKTLAQERIKLLK
jgi:hypothetical protein|tara:strand:- start:1072 stop:1266 length:195 start_codon:yes stop_codon:yes gene_type:complete